MEEIIGVFENKHGDYYWMDFLNDDEIEEAKYFMYRDKCCGYHGCEKSALYDDLDGYVDKLQDGENSLKDGELYVVNYFSFNDYWGLDQNVDFGITKQEIIENVKAQKYIEGAEYYTMGHMFFATRMMLQAFQKEEKEDTNFDYYEIEFGILADGAQTGDYETQANSMCIKAKKWPRLDEAAKWLEEAMKSFGCDCVHSVTRITEQEAMSSYYFDGSEPIFG